MTRIISSTGIALIIAAMISGCGAQSAGTESGSSQTGSTQTAASASSQTTAAATGQTTSSVSGQAGDASGSNETTSSSSGRSTDSASGQNSNSASSLTFDNARVSYLGPAGTYTEEAAQFFFPNSGSFSPETTVPEAIADVKEGKSDFAVIPQENTIGGAVTNYLDALIAEDGVYVVGEVILPINQTLMGVPGATLEDIKTVCSHAQGIKQSEEWRKQNLPNAETQEMDSTAAAASYVAETGDKTIAAVAAPGAANLYGLTVLAENVQITDANKTRFYVLSATRQGTQEETRAVFVAECEANRIDDIIVEIHDAGLEFVTLHDRPEGSKLGAYRYIIEVENSNGITEEDLESIGKIPEVCCLGTFNVMEKK